MKVYALLISLIVVAYTVDAVNGLTQCQKEVMKADARGNPPGSKRPSCSDIDGSYLPLQCWASIGYCWCSDKEGNELTDYIRDSDLNCAPIVGLSLKASPTTDCQAARDNVNSRGNPPGAYLPTCDSNGDYLPEQCWPSTGFCWCSDKKGNVMGKYIKGENVDCAPMASEKSPIARASELTKCQEEQNEANARGNLRGSKYPNCSKTDGSYLPLQCWGSIGKCWCSDKDGNELTDYIRDSNLDCEAILALKSVPVIKNCRAALDNINSNGTPPPGAYLPACDLNGDYVPEQCWPSTGFCWCSDKNGKMLGKYIREEKTNCMPILNTNVK